MRIISLEVIAVRLPFQEPVSDSLGTYSCSNHGLVKVTAESGLYGIGEIALAWFGGVHSLCQEVRNHWTSLVVGEHLTNINAICRKMDSMCSFSQRHLLAKAGVEMALFDLLGKHLNIPVYQLLGGKVRHSIPLTGGVPIDSIENMVKTAERKVEEGYKELKIKVGLDDRQDLCTVSSIRRAIPDHIRLRVDANMAWSNRKQAKRLIDEMVKWGVEIIEQPLPAEYIEDTVWLREHTDALILLDEGAWEIKQAKIALDKGAADLLHVYVSEAGGLAASRSLFELAALYNVPCTIGSMPEGRIGAVASAHLAIAMPNLSSFASDIRGFTGYQSDLVTEDLTIRDGQLFVPERPGLGLSLDEEQLDRLRI
ncbi:mandelate racemase/muconate lactonizing enzyme family protein [Paenibacillus senegalensis]|uniref:mandelate racemase/muconate lactonizing enzyme family protein n=1 Tax=Paenibacillus senegalensis TaxID=1465766 RepID=UPI000288ADCD|nr:mandelate racemase/muconate lactonizing enzyme family protein [Paenibacillus senegalensis]